MYENYQQFPGALPAGGTTLTSGTETAYLTAQPSNPPPPPQGVVISGYINATGGATGGGWAVKCRRGTGVAGTQVGNTQTITYPATTTTSFPFSFVDPQPPANQNGVYTVTVTAAGSNGTAVDGAIVVSVPVPYGEDV